MDEPTTPPEDFESKLRALDAHWAPIIASAEAAFITQRAKASAVQQDANAKIAILLQRAEANLLVLKSLNSTAMDSIRETDEDGSPIA